MTSQPCTEESTFSPIEEGTHSIVKTNFPSYFADRIQTTNTDDGDDLDLVTETSPFSTREQGGQKTQPATITSSNKATSLEQRQPKKPSFCHKYWKKILIIVLVFIFMSMTVMSVFIVWILNEISKIKEPKSVMLYRPTVEYLENDDRPNTMEWHLVEEHSQYPFTQLNATHLHVKKDGFYHISCSLLMETNNKYTNVITLLIFYANKEKSIYTKKTLATGFSRFSLKQSIVLHLLQGDYFYVKVFPSKYIIKDPGPSYLSIVQK